MAVERMEYALPSMRDAVRITHVSYNITYVHLLIFVIIPVGSDVDSSNRQLYVPKVLTIVSHFPYYNLMMGILREIYSVAVTGKTAGFNDTLRSRLAIPPIFSLILH